MGDSRARSNRTGTALPMTHRQQKRASQRPQPSQRASRTPKPRSTPPVAAANPPVPISGTDETAKPSSPAGRSARPDERPKKTLSPVRSSAASEKQAPPRTQAPGTPTRPTRTRKTDAVSKRTLGRRHRAVAGAPDDSNVVARDADSAPIATEAPTQAKRYPTLAKIAAVRRPAPVEEQRAVTDIPQGNAAHQEMVEALEDTAPTHPSEFQSHVSDIDAAETRPVRARPPAVTRRLQATRDDAAIASLRHEAHEREVDPHESAAPRRMPRPRPHPLAEVDLTLPVAGAHAAIAAVAALAGAALLVQGASGAIWPLMLTAIAGIGGWLAYIVGQQTPYRGAAGLVLTLSQVGVLVWLMLVIGPRGSLVATAPAIALLALRMSGLLVAIAGSTLAVAAYLTLSLLAISQRLRPAVRITGSFAIALDVMVVGAGVFVALLALDLWHRQHARLDQKARGRLREARALRAQGAQDRRQLDEDLQQVEDALAEALRGQGISQLRLGPEFDAVAERVTVVAERLHTLQRDREDRLRIEGALRGLIREVERAWLGLPWAWPAPSGTTLDELIALLRAPRSYAAPDAWPDETPTLTPIPSASSRPSRPWDVVSQSDHAWNSRPRDWLYAQLPLGLDESDPGHGVPARGSQPPWQEWDVWRDWDSNQSSVVGG